MRSQSSLLKLNISSLRICHVKITVAQVESNQRLIDLKTTKLSQQSLLADNRNLQTTISDLQTQFQAQLLKSQAQEFNR